MPTPAYCALDQVYGDWNNDEIKNNQRISSQPVEPTGPPVKSVQTPKESINVNFDAGNDIRSFCPSCKNCLKANDALQQKIIDINTYPLPRWIPQNPQPYAPYDPYNRYWANNHSHNGREDFGNIFEHMGRNGNNIEILLKITIFIMSVLFIILLVDILFKNKST